MLCLSIVKILQNFLMVVVNRNIIFQYFSNLESFIFEKQIGENKFSQKEYLLRRYRIYIQVGLISQISGISGYFKIQYRIRLGNP